MRREISIAVLFLVLTTFLISSCNQSDDSRNYTDIQNTDSVLLTILLRKDDFQNSNLLLRDSTLSQKEDISQSILAEFATYNINGEYTIHNKSYYINFFHRLWRYQDLASDDLDKHLLYNGVPEETSILTVDSIYLSEYSKCATFVTSEFKQCNIVLKRKNIVSTIKIEISKEIKNQEISDLISPVLSKIVNRLDIYENSHP